MTREATRPGAEFKMAIAGPVCSLVLGGLFYGISLLTSGLGAPMNIMFRWLAIINIALAAFNLIPGFPLDGGRVLRSIMWRRSGDYMWSTRIATRVGQGVGYLFIAGGIAVVFLQPFGLNWFSGLWLTFIGWFLGNAASASYRQSRWRGALDGVKAFQVMTSDVPVVSPDIMVNRLVQEHIFPSGRHYFMVFDGDRLAGALALSDIKSVPQERWETTWVKDVMTPLHKLEVAYPDQDASSVLEQMDAAGISQMPVISEGRVIGLITRDNLLRFLRTRSALGM